MKIVFFTHPGFINSQSMPRFANYLLHGMKERDHEVELWTPTPRFYNLRAPGVVKKWLGYIDQFIIFPNEVRRRLTRYSKKTLFVFTDQALGPWVPLVSDRFHVIHCHDFLAQRSALNEIPENPVKFLGKKYQSYIRRGYQKGNAFISVSSKTREDLLKFLHFDPAISEVVYNALNYSFYPIDRHEARISLSKRTGLNLASGYLLHVGGNQWYKNRIGVIKLYTAWRKISNTILPLILVGEPPSDSLLSYASASPVKDDIHFISGLNNVELNIAYSGCSTFVFPSLAEGFGWPIVEAMASGCLVVTTGEAPMTEVGGDAATYITKKPLEDADIEKWADDSAKIINDLILLPGSKSNEAIQKGLDHVKKFNASAALNKIEEIYKEIVKEF